ncbi:MAG: molybdopterin molybdotransferase MoeA [Bacteroidales bacterium]
MIGLEQAKAITGKHLIRKRTEMVSLDEAPGRVLAVDILAERDMPPFDRATMDGYACRRQDLPGPLAVLEIIPAGKLPKRSVEKGQCSRIMTGAMIPEGANCVIMQEYVKTDQEGRILFTASDTDTNIHPGGQDLKKGAPLIPAGTLLTNRHIGIIASAGKMRITVARSLQIGILATGSELVEPDRQPEGAQIRNSNSHQLAALIRHAGHLPEDFGIVEDQRELLRERIGQAVRQVDLLLLTGGASVGELDLVPGTLKELGFRLEFDRVAMQPGKPVCFAHRDSQVVFGLSGNPVSSFVQFEMLVRPYLEQCTGAIVLNNRVRVVMASGYHRKHADRMFFLPVFFTGDGTCEPVPYHGSGHLHALAGAAGFAEMATGQTDLNQGDEVYVRLI